MFAQQQNSPWGMIQHCDKIIPGVFMVFTASHGGMMVAQDMTAILSPAARKYGMNYNGFLCFEQDSAENIVFRELLDKKLWVVPDRIRDKAAYEERINDSLREYYPDYWRARQAGREKAITRHSVSAHAHSAEL